MAEYGEWNRKGATLCNVTAKKEYGVDRNFIVKGMHAVNLEHQEGAIWWNLYRSPSRSQLEKYIAEELVQEHLSRVNKQTELRKIVIVQPLHYI
jgi:hypothetical protein